MKQRVPIAVLISGNGSNLQALIDYQQQPNCHYEITTVISNRPHAYGLERAKKAGIPAFCIDHTHYSSRETFERAIIEQLEAQGVQLVVLAGFMRILSPVLVTHYLGRMLNIHPSLLPKYPGLNTHKRAIEAGDQEHGLSIHFVTEELDGGPVIFQAKVPISAEDTPQSLQQKVHQLEHQSYPLVTNCVCQGKLIYQSGQVFFQQQPLRHPLTLADVTDCVKMP
ncbi:phosphoribosylglycinamide formyltransferase [Galenea microaerophila]